MGFILDFESINGYKVGKIDAPTYLKDLYYTSGEEPGAGTPSGFAIWSPDYADYSGQGGPIDEYDQIEGVDISISDLSAWLTNSAQPFFEIPIEGSNIPPEGGRLTFGLWGSNPSGTSNVAIVLYRTTYDENDNITDQRTFGSTFQEYIPGLSNFKVICGYFSRNGYNYVGFGTFITYGNYRLKSMVNYIVESNFSNVTGGGQPAGDASSPEFGKAAKKKGGYNPKHHRKGTFDDSSDKITVSTKPGTSPLSTGFIHGYTVNRSQLDGFSRALFPPQPTSFADIPSAIMGLIATIVNNKKPDYILDFLIVPVVPSTGEQEVVTVAGSYLRYADDQGLVHFVHGNPINVNSCYVDHQCGSITIPEYWANFLDFSGSRFKLFLPYVGYVDIQPEYINGGNLKVWYRFNVFDGSFMCYVESTSGHSELDESLIAQYAGVAAVHIPVQARDYSNKISGLISAMGVVAAGATGGISAAAGMGAAASLGNTMVQKPGSTHANGYNASSSFLSHRKPYLIVERQSSQFSEKYPEERGLPLFMQAKIGQCSGLTVCDNPHLDTIPATMEEKERIYKYLTEGIIV